MLKGITWGQFSIFILLATGAYYLYVFAVFYKGGALGARRRKGEATPGLDTRDEGIGKEDSTDEAGMAVPEKVKELPEGGVKPSAKLEGTANRGHMLEGKVRLGEMKEEKAKQVASSKGKGVAAAQEDLPQLALKAISTIRQVITQGIENKLDRQNVMDHVGEVLRDYKKLRKTEHAETINNVLVRVCANDLSLELGEKELAELWK